MNTRTTLPFFAASGIRDNYQRGSVGDYLKETIRPKAELSVVSAYFTIYAFDALKEQLWQIERMRFLFGEPSFIRSVDPATSDKKAFDIADEGLQLKNRLEQKRVARECARWLEEKVDIRSIRRRNLLHGKMYHIAHEGREGAILGSSNFTVGGLGLGSVNNIELNLEVDSARDRNDLKAWFEEVWENDDLVKDVKAEVLLYLAQLYENHAPEFIYYKTLFHLFEKFLTDQDQTGWLDAKSQLIDTVIWNSLFEFQKDGVKGAINKILKHNGCIIADSVGLGKTYEALAVIKYFELRNDKVLVLCPKKLRENWTVYQVQNNSELNPFVNDRFGYSVLSHTDLSREQGRSGDIDLQTVNWGNYDLVVIDESHNFRNNTKGRRDEQGEIIVKSRYERMMEDILRAGVRTKVLLLSATPVNNDLKDLRNQIYLLTEGADNAYADSIGIASIRDTLSTAQRTFTEWANDRTTPERRTSVLLEKLSAAFFTMLDELTIARSRRHLQKYYADTLLALGPFPERLKPISVFPEIDLRGRFMSYDKLNDEISNYRLSLFSPSQYLKPEFRGRYEGKAVRNFTQKDREHFLIGMMKVNFLKRLESSVNSFEISMRRTIDKIERLEEKIRAYQQYRDANMELDWDEIDLEDLEDDDLQEALQVGSKLKFDLAHLDVDAWLKDLRKDKQQLSQLYLSAQDVGVERDAKLQELKAIIENKVRRPTRTIQGRENRKILVFTAFADTASYLYEALETWAREELNVHIALVSGGATGNKTTFGKTEFNNVLTNFSPIAKRRDKMRSLPQDGEIDLLIATDCISEGQNLQDCDCVINYDIHWNPVRLIQRFGRIDRIGSVNTAIQLVNFWPTEDLNKYINLKNRVEARMALVDIAATSQDDILNAEEIQELIETDLNYRDQQLLRLKEEVLDMEDLNETVTLNEFTLDDFRMELSKYIEANRKKLEEAPLGLYAVVPPHADYTVIGPGVLFCLKQKGDTSGNEAINPLQPHFLVYVRDNGDIRYTFTHPKQILEIFRVTCADKKVPYESLCTLFDRQTGDGSDMSRYSALLEKAVGAIAGTFRRKSANSLTTGRSAVLADVAKQVRETTDFELITWLVVLGTP
jgi:SNF2 family DNA or RNA helicase